MGEIANNFRIALDLVVKLADPLPIFCLKRLVIVLQRQNLFLVDVPLVANLLNLDFQLIDLVLVLRDQLIQLPVRRLNLAGIQTLVKEWRWYCPPIASFPIFLQPYVQLFHLFVAIDQLGSQLLVNFLQSCSWGTFLSKFGRQSISLVAITVNLLDPTHITS